MELLDFRNAMEAAPFLHGFRAEVESWRTDPRDGSYPVRISRDIRSRDICISMLRERRLLSLKKVDSVGYSNGVLTLWVGNEAHQWRIYG